MQMNKQLKLFTVSVGTDDFLYEPREAEHCDVQGKENQGRTAHCAGRAYLDELQTVSGQYVAAAF